MTTTLRASVAGALAAGVLLSIAPAASADPVPGPEPVPVPVPTPDNGFAGCQNGEVMQDGNCVPNMTSSTGEEGMAGPMPEAPLRYTDEHTSTTQSGLPADLVPNINGTPCTGYWMSAACYAENQDRAPAVVPRSTLSASP